MKKSYLIFVSITLQILFSTLYAQVVYTPRGTSIEVNTFSAGNVAYFESQAAAYLSAMGWTNLVTKTGDATGAYNCHGYAWYGTSYWMNAFLDADLQQFDPYYYYTTLPDPDNLSNYWEDGSYTSVTESNSTKVFYGSCWEWDSYYGWTNPCDHSARRITSGANAGKYESKWGSWGRYIHSSNICPYDDSQRNFYVLNPCPPYYISTSLGSCSSQPDIYTDENGYAGITLYALVSSAPSPNTYVWSASWDGDCDRWYMWPSGSHADFSFYLNPGDEGGVLTIECDMYSGATLLGTGVYYQYVFPQ